MSRLNARLLVSCWMALACGLSHAAETDPSKVATITIFHTNDIHGHLDAWKGWEGELKDKTIGGLDRLAARVRQQRATLAPNSSLLLDAGDTIGDTMIADETEGRAIIETMNAMGYDAKVVGNHEPDYTAEKLRTRIAEAGFPVLQAGAHGSDLGRLDLNIANGKVASFQRTLISVTGPESDSAAATTIAQQKAPFEQKMNAVVGNATNVIPRAQTIAGQEPAKRDGESPADDLFADAVRESTQTQIAFLPGVGYGVALQPGTITAANLRNLIPHDSAVWTMRLTGGQIRDVLEQSIENFMTQDTTKKVGGMIQVSGLQFSYKPDAPFNQRVQTVTVAGKSLEFARYYAVATNALLAQGGHNYVTFKRGRDRKEGGKQFDLVKAWIAARGNVSAPPTDRITKIEGQ
ncbi:MAG: bifunctional metallophosphatase/5'-nucleotidase [Thiobacillus sp.]